jgi:acetoacetate decarboxylase
MKFDKLTIAYLILIALTTFAYVLGKFELMNKTFFIILVVTTFIKGSMVIDYFMELKEVNLKYRLIPLIWLFIVLSGIVIGYYF